MKILKNNNNIFFLSISTQFNLDIILIIYKKDYLNYILLYKDFIFVKLYIFTRNIIEINANNLYL